MSLHDKTNDELNRMAAESRGWRMVEPMGESPYYVKGEPPHVESVGYHVINYHPATDLTQAAEFFMGMSESQQCNAALKLASRTPNAAWRLRAILDPNHGATNLVVACLESMDQP